MERTPEKITRRRFIELLIAAGAITTGAITLGGCAQKSSNDEQSQSSSNADTKNTKRASTVTDFKGREITVPEQIERIGITCMGGCHSRSMRARWSRSRSGNAFNGQKLPPVT